MNDELIELFSTQEEQMEHPQGRGHIHTCASVHVEYLQHSWCSPETRRQKATPKVSPPNEQTKPLFAFLHNIALFLFVLS